MSTIKIRGHFLPTYNAGWPDVPTKKINLLIDYENREKILNVAQSLTGITEPKTPLSRKGSDILLTVSLSDVALYTNDGAAASISDLLGLEITVALKAQRYSLTSKYEKNAGAKIIGISLKLLSASS